MTNVDLDFAEKIYGGEKAWYVTFKTESGAFRLDGPMDLSDAKSTSYSYVDSDEDIAKAGVKILIDWNELRRCCEDEFGK